MSTDTRPTSAQRGYSYRWQQARKQFLALHPLCRMCMDAGLVVPASVVDHIKPHRGDPILMWSRSNWQALCASCHSGAKQRIEHGHGPQRIGLDGWPIEATGGRP